MNGEAVRLIGLRSAHVLLDWATADGESPFSLRTEPLAVWCVLYKISRSMEASISFSIPLSIELAGEVANSEFGDILKQLYGE